MLLAFPLIFSPKIGYLPILTHQTALPYDTTSTTWGGWRLTRASFKTHGAGQPQFFTTAALAALAVTQSSVLLYIKRNVLSTFFHIHWGPRLANVIDRRESMPSLPLKAQGNMLDVALLGFKLAIMLFCHTTWFMVSPKRNKLS